MRWAVVVIMGSILAVGTVGVVPPRASAASLQAQVLGPYSVQLDWIPECVSGGAGPPCNGYQTTSYTIYLKNGTYQSYWEYVDALTNVAVTSYTVIGLQADTMYQFRVDESGWYGTLQSNVATVTTEALPPPPNERPSLSILRPGAGESFAAGTTITIEWSVADDRDRPEDLVVYLNFSGPASGAIAGPISGQTTRLTWTIASELRGVGFRILGVAIDSDGGQRPAESAEFTVTGSPPPPDTDPFWKISTALLTVAVAGLTAGLLLAVRVQLGEWYRRKREARRQRAGGQERFVPPPR